MTDWSKIAASVTEIAKISDTVGKTATGLMSAEGSARSLEAKRAEMELELVSTKLRGMKLD